MAQSRVHTTYFDPKAPGSYAGLSTFKKAHPSLKDVAKVLQQYPAYTMHKPTRRGFPRNRVVVGGIDHQWQMDLADLSKLSRYNDGYNFLLCCIDILSKFAWIVPLQQKSAKHLTKAFAEILSTKRKPFVVQTDQGTEFLNRSFQQLLKEHGIHFFNTFNEETKASVIERLHRTIKGRMWRYFTHNNTYHYLDVLQDLVHSYNHTYHRSIKTTPASVTPENAQKVWQVLYADLDHDPPSQV